MKKFMTSVAIILLAFISLNSCKKDVISEEPDEIAPVKSHHGHLEQTKTFSSEVAFKWMDMQLHLILTNPAPLGGSPSLRYYIYGAIALYESVVPGMPSYQSLSGQLTEMPAMPNTLPGTAYYWPACANAAMASMTRSFFTAATPANKARIDSLENALNDAYKLETDTATFNRSANFGKAVAELIFNWAITDGSANANAPYTPPVGPGLWVPTPPAYAPASIPYWGNNRLLVATSLDIPAPDAPPVYSTDPVSDYYIMMKEVYDASFTLTDEQKAVAIFYGGQPGVRNYGGGGYLSTLMQILEQENRPLDFTAYAYAKTCIGLYDVSVVCFKIKYIYNQQRPVTFVRTVLGDATWNSFVTTPAFPDFLAGHSSNAGVFAEILEGLLGTNYHFSDHTYDFQGQEPRYYNSLDEMVLDVNDARFYGGIHSRFSCTEGAELGRNVGTQVENTLHFKKD